MNEDNWYQDSGETPDQHHPAGSAARQGMSTGMKVFIGVMIVAGIVGLLCCGGLFFIGSKVASMATEDPEEIRQIQEQVADIEIPAGLEPRGGMDFGMFGVKMKMAVYEGGDATLMLMQMTGPGDMADISDEQMRDQFRQGMQQQGRQSEIEVESTEERTLTVAGEEVPFEFVKGKTRDGEEVRQVSGLFAGRRTAFLLYQVPESDWDEDQVVNMIQGIQN